MTIRNLILFFFIPLGSGQESHPKLRLALPTDYQPTKEILKIFATKGLANFQWLILPALDNELQTRGNLNVQLRSKAKELRTREKAQIINPFNNLLSAIGRDLNKPLETTRAMVYEPDSNAE